MMIMPTTVSSSPGAAKESSVTAQGADESGFSGVAERLRDLLGETDEPQLVPPLDADTTDTTDSIYDAEMLDSKQSGNQNPDETVITSGADDQTPGDEVSPESAPESGVPAALTEETQLVDEPKVLLPVEAGESSAADGMKNRVAEPAVQLWHWHYSRRTGSESRLPEQTLPVQAELRAEKVTTTVAASGRESARVTLVGTKTDGEILAGGNSALAANKLLLQQLTTTFGPVAVLPGKEEVAAQQGNGAAVALNTVSGITRTTAASIHEWAPVTVEPGNKATLGAQLVVALKDKVELQLNQDVQQARIKLDPPEMGRLELSIRLDGDRLHVHITASQGAVRDALIAQADKLRSDLLPHHSGGVEVNVGQGSQQKREADPKGDQGISLAQSERFESAPREHLGRGWINALV